MTRLVLWRHGQTDWNAEGRFQGMADIDLNDTGRRQAALSAEVLAGLGPTHLYSSDLSRAMNTARALAAITGLDITPDAELREINVGDWAGLTGDQAREREPRFTQWLTEGIDFRRSDTGETATELGERVSGALHRIAAHHGPEDVVVIATHGMAARVGACFFLGLDFSDSTRLRGMHNCAWLILDRPSTGRWVMEAYNVTAEAPSADPQVSR